MHLVQDKGYRNLIFDLDWTLTKLDVPWPKWTKQIADSLPQEVSEKLKAMLAIEGSAWGEVINEYLQNNHGFYKKYIAICQEFEKAHFAHTPYQALIEVLPTLKEQGANLYVWTSNTRATAEHALRDTNVLHLFSQLLTREDVILGKPNAEGWTHFPFAANPETCLMIGDSKNDELVAKATGMDYFNVTFFATST